MNYKEFPILEFDGSSKNIIEPKSYLKPISIPENVVICFYQEVIDKLLKENKLQIIYNLHSQIGKHPVYLLEHDDTNTAIFHPGIGAPLGVALMEEVIALGGRKFISCGSGGVLDKKITTGSLLVPITALRDEGTSYHYKKPSREISVNKHAVYTIESVLTMHKCNYKLIKTWTTDAFFRETIDKVAMRKEEGCLIAKMECSAFCALAEYRGVVFGQILYGGDDISCVEWDRRQEIDRTFIREKVFWFSVEASLKL